LIPSHSNNATNSISTSTRENPFGRT
jgi:hypothetical protein